MKQNEIKTLNNLSFYFVLLYLSTTTESFSYSTVHLLLEKEIK